MADVLVVIISETIPILLYWIECNMADVLVVIISETIPILLYWIECNMAAQSEIYRCTVVD